MDFEAGVRRREALREEVRGPLPATLVKLVLDYVCVFWDALVQRRSIEHARGPALEWVLWPHADGCVTLVFTQWQTTCIRSWAANGEERAWDGLPWCRGVLCAEPFLVLDCGSNGHVLRREGREWSTPRVVDSLGQTDVACSPDGQRLVWQQSYLCDDGTVRVYDWRSGLVNRVSSECHFWAMQPFDGCTALCVGHGNLYTLDLEGHAWRRLAPTRFRRWVCARRDRCGRLLLWRNGAVRQELAVLQPSATDGFVSVAHWAFRWRDDQLHTHPPASDEDVEEFVGEESFEVAEDEPVQEQDQDELTVGVRGADGLSSGLVFVCFCLLGDGARKKGFALLDLQGHVLHSVASEHCLAVALGHDERVLVLTVDGLHFVE